MNTQNNAYKTALNSSDPIDPRIIEADALTKSSALLHKAEISGDREFLIEILKKNLTLWTIFQASTVDKDTIMSDEIRANILSLSIYIDSQTTKILNNEAKVESIIKINKMIADGLRQSAKNFPLETNIKPSLDGTINESV